MRLVNANSWVRLRSQIKLERDRAKNSIGPDNSLHMVKLIEAAALDQALGMMESIEGDGRAIREKLATIESRAMGLVKDAHGDFGPKSAITFELRALIGAAIAGDEARFAYHQNKLDSLTDFRYSDEAQSKKVEHYIETTIKYLDEAQALNKEVGCTAFC